MMRDSTVFPRKASIYRGDYGIFFPVFLVLFGGLVLFGVPVWAQIGNVEDLPGPEEATWLLEAGSQTQVGDELVAEGHVNFEYSSISLRADKITFNRATRVLKAEGGVVYFDGSRKVTGDFMEVDMDTNEGFVLGAVVFEVPTYFFSGERIEMLDSDRYILYKAFYTTCNQPNPYWGARATKTKVRLGGYARFSNLRLTVRGVPIFYLPYWVWPVKQDRATGLLIPEPGYSDVKGFALREQLFIVLGRSADATLTYDYFGKEGTGVGLELRVKPGLQNTGLFESYFIKEHSTGKERHYIHLEDDGKFWGGSFRAQVELVSDLNYYRKFKETFDEVSKRRNESEVYFSRNWRTYSMNTRFRREKNFVDQDHGFVTTALPTLTIRRRRTKIWEKRSFYLDFEGVVTNIGKRSPVFDTTTGDFVENINNQYYRTHFRPALALPFSPAPWFDMDFEWKWTGTYYSKSKDPDDSLRVVDDDFFRKYWRGEAKFLGPRFYRVFNSGKSKLFSSYKHLLEPQVNYSYQTKDKRAAANVPIFDTYDTNPNFEHKVSYALVNYLYAKGETTQDSAKEIAKLSLRQEFSLVDGRYLSSKYDRDGNLLKRSHRGPVSASFRLYPFERVGFDLTSHYHTLYNAVDDISVSLEIHKDRSTFISGTWVLDKNLATGEAVNNQVRARGGMAFLNQKLVARWEFNYDFVNNLIQQQRYSLLYKNQCSSFQFDIIQKTLGDFEDIEYHFMVELKDVGRILSMQ